MFLSGRCAAASCRKSADSSLYTLNGSNAQKFRITRVKDTADVSGTCKILSSLSEKKAADIRYGGLDDGTNLQLWRDNGSRAQAFVFMRNADGTYQILNRNSRKALDVKGGGKEAGTEVWQYTCNGTDAQKWILIQEDGYTVLRAKCSGNVLDLACADLSGGTDIRSWPWNKSGAQKWKITAN